MIYHIEAKVQSTDMDLFKNILEKSDIFIMDRKLLKVPEMVYNTLKTKIA